MKVPILLAKCSKKLFILWQVDVGYYEELPAVQQQLVKSEHILDCLHYRISPLLTKTVWQIVDPDEVRIIPWVTMLIASTDIL
jgi:hypothetical protein